jgi:ERCC4-related helicase
MLIDNKTLLPNSPFRTVCDFLKGYSEGGTLDVVTGFYSVNALAMLHEHLTKTSAFRLILGNLMQEELERNKVVDLLNGDAGINSTLLLSAAARKAVEFLKQDKVAVRTVLNNFCHAKSYIYQDVNPRNNYHIVGSANLTDAGLGMRDSSNVELNIASTGNDHDWQDVRRWFDNLWKDRANEEIPLPDKSMQTVKQYIIDLISMMFKEYSPLDLYYKVLYEIFKDDLLALSDDAEFNREIKHLKETLLYQTLYRYQENGVISLIKMLQKFNGAVLADAVGLGKTWTALAVMKYFQSKGYTVLLFCPKKLENNWLQYNVGGGSKFDKDEIEFWVRYHSDLQDDRLDSNHYPDCPLTKIQRRQKLLVVIDESHNLRNDKSSRYKYLVDNILQPDKSSRDVKVLQLSATPINNRLLDIRNQFKLITKGQDDGFAETSLDINSLESVFRQAQRDFADWCKKPNRKIHDFIAKLPEPFFKLTDALIVARTRKLITTNESESMKFPQKEKPENVYITPENFGKLKSFDDILAATKIDMTAYRPSAYILERKKGDFKAIEDEVQRESFLVKMMQILMIKRLESSWHSFKLTVENILRHHENALTKVNQFMASQKDDKLEDNMTAEDVENLEGAAEETALNEEVTLGKKNPIKLSEISAIKTFHSHLERDVKKLRHLKENLDEFEKKFNEDTLLDNETLDPKLNRLLTLIVEKQKQPNKKVLIFTVYKDTAAFLYRQIKKRKLGKVAFVSGAQSETEDYSGKSFEGILERFAPYTKLYNEKDWTDLYNKASLDDSFLKNGKWNVPYEKWLSLVEKHKPETFQKIEKPIDILIATDCLSEGQNLQDCDQIVNYDIHWNPVRLIQRMGRIDRLNSPNSRIRGVNFWPAKNFDDYLKLKNRVENRMAAMTLVGTEIDTTTTAELEEIVKDNPLISEQSEKMLQQMQLTWDDIEDSEETLGLNDLSLEQFRQELFDFFKQHEDFFKSMPNGIYTGFRFGPNSKCHSMPNSIVAVLGSPRRPENTKDWTYSEIHLLHQPLDCADDKFHSATLRNRQDVLNLLRHHKSEARYVPREIDKGDTAELKKIADALARRVKAEARLTSVSEIQGLFSGTGGATSSRISATTPKNEEKFKPENFDLIVWFLITPQE